MAAIHALLFVLLAPEPAPPEAEVAGKATIRLMHAVRIGAPTFDLEAPHARVVVRQEGGRTIQLHLIEFE